ncbi:XRE family transcriptional regulator [Sphingomonas qilianensis]|uniref:XRE family transcriptional regulator n=1 Tax=Sphingomonas qilianensis TaxID=1736690 RepID=A0ABU9XVL8_9SPHN
MMLSVAQCRAARALLGWAAAELASTAAVGIMTVHRFESGEPVRQASLDKIIAAFSTAGVTFIEAGAASPDGGEGVRFVPS